MTNYLFYDNIIFRFLMIKCSAMCCVFICGFSYCNKNAPTELWSRPRRLTTWYIDDCLHSLCAAIFCQAVLWFCCEMAQLSTCGGMHPWKGSGWLDCSFIWKIDKYHGDVLVQHALGYLTAPKSGVRYWRLICWMVPDCHTVYHIGGCDQLSNTK